MYGFKTITSLFVAAGLMTLPLSAQAATITIQDETLVHESTENGLGGNGWIDVAGDANLFDTTKMTVDWTNDDITISLFTNFPTPGSNPLGGNGMNGIEAGWADNLLFHTADLGVDLDMDGTYETSIALSSHKDIPEDPLGDRPGAGTYDQIDQGTVYSNTTWFTSRELHLSDSLHADDWDNCSDPGNASADCVGGNDPIVWIQSGTAIGSGSVVQNNIDPDMGMGLYRIDVTLTGINANGGWNNFGLLWGTDSTFNDGIVGKATNPDIPGEPIPEPGTILLMGTGLAGLAFWRSRKLKA